MLIFLQMHQTTSTKNLVTANETDVKTGNLFQWLFLEATTLFRTYVLSFYVTTT